jgi:hypothetical protein
MDCRRQLTLACTRQIGFSSCQLQAAIVASHSSGLSLDIQTDRSVKKIP